MTKAELNSFLPKELLTEERSHCSLPYEVFVQALQGFILVTTAQGKLVYVSENVAEYLGLSMVSFNMKSISTSFGVGVVTSCVFEIHWKNLFNFLQVDVLQGDTFYDMVERSDIDIVKSNLDSENKSSPGNFTYFFQLFFF